MVARSCDHRSALDWRIDRDRWWFCCRTIHLHFILIFRDHSKSNNYIEHAPVVPGTRQVLPADTFLLAK